MGYLQKLLEEEEKKKPSQIASDKNKVKAEETKSGSLKSLLEESNRNPDLFKVKEAPTVEKPVEPPKKNLFDKAKDVIGGLFKKKEEVKPVEQTVNPFAPTNLGVGTVQTELGQKIEDFKVKKRAELNEPLEQKVYKVQKKYDETSVQIEALSNEIMNGAVKPGEVDSKIKIIDELKKDASAYKAYLDHPASDVDFFLEVEKARKKLDPSYKEPGFGGQFVESIKQTTADALSSFGASAEMIGNMTDNILLSEVGRDLNKKYQKVIAANPEWNEKDGGLSWKDPSKYSRLLGGALPTLLGSVGTGLVVTLATGGNVPAGVTASFAYGFSLEGGSIYKEAKSYGVSEGDAQKWGTLVGSVNGVLEMIFPAKIISGKQIIGNEAREQISKSVAKNILNEAKRTGVKILENGTIEGSEEVTQQLVSNAVAKNYDKNRSVWDGVTESFVGGFMSGGVVGSFEKTEGDVSTPQTDPATIARTLEKNKVMDEKVPEMVVTEGGPALTTSPEGAGQTQKDKEDIVVPEVQLRADLPTAVTEKYQELIKQDSAKPIVDNPEMVRVYQVTNKETNWVFATPEQVANYVGNTLSEGDKFQFLDVLKSQLEAHPNRGEGIYTIKAAPVASTTTKLPEAVKSIATVENGKYRFAYRHNTQKKSFGEPNQFGQNIEPAGKYMNITSVDKVGKSSGTTEAGVIEFAKPFVLDATGMTSKEWKENLSKQFGGETGRRLSIAMIKKGYDGIITTEDGHTSEVVHFDKLLPSNFYAKKTAKKKAVKRKKVSKKIKTQIKQRQEEKSAKKAIAQATRDQFEKSDLQNIAKLKSRAKAKEVVEGDIETLRKRAGDLVEKVVEAIRTLPQYAELNDEDALAVAMDIPTANQARTGDYSMAKDGKYARSLDLNNRDDVAYLKRIFSEETVQNMQKGIFNYGGKDKAYMEKIANANLILGEKKVIKAKNTSGKALEARALKKYGVTTRPELMAYITTDGIGIDGSGRKFADKSNWAYMNDRTVDHREIAQVVDEAGSESELLMIFQEKSGAIRTNVSANEFGIDLVKRPTEEQFNAIRRYSKDREIVVDITSTKNGETIKSGFFKTFGEFKNFVDKNLPDTKVGKGDFSVAKDEAIAVRRDADTTKETEKVDPAKTPEALKEKIDQLNRFAQANAILRRTGGINNKKAVGQFVKPGKNKLQQGVAPEGEVRLRGKYIANDADYIGVLAHELGHSIDFTVTGTTNEKTYQVFGDKLTAAEMKTIKDELTAVTKELEGEMAYNSNKEYYDKPSELLARFFEKLIVSPSNIEEIAPTAYELIQEQQVKYPIINEFFEVVRGDLFKKPGFMFLPDLKQTYQKVLGSVRVGSVAYNNEIAHRAMQERAKLVLTKFIEDKFKGVKDDPALLFRTAEAIKITVGDTPEFGTRDFAVAKTDKEATKLEEAGYELVDTQIVDGEVYPKYAKQRYSAEEGQAMFEQLSPEGQRLLMDFTLEKEEAKDYFNRNVIKDTNKINSDIEGWVHHFFDEEPTGVGGKMKLKFRKASAAQFRSGSEGYVEDFKKAMTKAVVNLEATKVFNDFIQRQMSMISKPIPEGSKPDAGWTEVVGNVRAGVGTAQEKRTTIIKDGKRFVAKQARYQIPTAIYKRYQLWTGLVEEASTATRIMNSLNRYWQVNVLFHIGSASTNFISGGLQYGSKVLTDFYTETLTGNIKYTQTRKDVSAMLKVLLPKGWADAPDYIYGADLSNWYGNFTQNKGLLDTSVDAYADKALKLYGMIERYWKKTIMVAENVEDLSKLNQITKDGLRLPTKEEREIMAQINNEVDLFAYDYDNIPVWLQAHTQSVMGAMLKPFAKYPYKYAKMILNMAGSVFDRSQPWQVRTAKLLSLATMVAVYGAMAEDRKKKQETVEGDENTPARMSPRGKLFLGKDAEGNEMFLRSAKYPFFNITNAGISLAHGEISGAMDLVTDMLGSIGPVAKVGLLTVFGYRNKYELYDPEPVIIGNALASYVPGYRIINDISNFLDPFKRKQKTFGQTFTRLIPTTDPDLQEKLHGEIRTERIPIEGNVKRRSGQKLSQTTFDLALKQYKWDILLSSLTGGFITRINPEYANATKIRSEKNKVEAEKAAQKEKRKIFTN